MKIAATKVLMSKKLWIFIAATGLLITALSVYLLGNARQQASFDTASTRYDRMQTLSKATFAPDGKAANRVEAISELAQLQAANSCKADWWNDWQQSLPRTEPKAQECRKRETQIARIALLAQNVQQYIASETVITKQIATLRIDSKAKNWQQTALGNATSALKIIDDTEPVESAEALKKASNECITNIIKAWNALNQASTKQDKTAYLTAETNLKQAYVNLGAITDVADVSLGAVVTPLKTATSKL